MLIKTPTVLRMQRKMLDLLVVMPKPMSSRDFLAIRKVERKRHDVAAVLRAQRLVDIGNGGSRRDRLSFARHAFNKLRGCTHCRCQCSRMYDMRSEC